MATTKYGTKQTTPRLYYERKLWGVCVICGKPLRNGETTISCVDCLAKRKKQVAERRDKVREQSREFRRKHRAAGLCRYCRLPALEGRSICEYHREYYSLLRKAKKEQSKDAEEA